MNPPIEHDDVKYDMQNFIDYVNQNEGKDPYGNDISQDYGYIVDPSKLIISSVGFQIKCKRVVNDQIKQNLALI